MSMEPSERTIVYGLVAACIVGIIIVGGFLFFAQGEIFSGQGFSEVYFEEHQKLPAVIYDIEPLSFSFTVASHNKETTDYSYDVIAGEQIIGSGSFTLPNDNPPNGDPKNRYNKTVFIEDVRLRSTLISLNEPVVSETQFTYNGGLGLLLPGDGTKPQVVTDPSKLYYPVRLPMSGESATLIFNADTHETFHTTTTSKQNKGDITTISDNEKAVEIKGQRISDVGYDITTSEWTVKNDLGTISATGNSSTQSYRYAFKKISVDVRASPESDPVDITNYKIHFWVVVEDSNE